MPKIISAFTERNQSLPMLTRVLIDISYFCSHYGIYCVFFIVGCVFCYQRVKLHPVIEQRRHAWLLKIPLLNTIIQLFNTTRFFYTASILTHAGIDLLHTLEMAKMAILNVMIRQGVTCSVDKIKNGTSLYFALKETGFFDPLALQLIANGEKSGRLAEMFSYSASQQEQKLTRYTNVFLTLFEPIIILMMGGIILLIVLAILLPIFSMDQLVQLQ
jgi:general secretion pathway protein F